MYAKSQHIWGHVKKKPEGLGFCSYQPTLYALILNNRWRDLSVHIFIHKLEYWIFICWTSFIILSGAKNGVRDGKFDSILSVSCTLYILMKWLKTKTLICLRMTCFFISIYLFVYLFNTEYSVKVFLKLWTNVLSVTFLNVCKHSEIKFS